MLGQAAVADVLGVVVVGGGRGRAAAAAAEHGHQVGQQHVDGLHEVERGRDQGVVDREVAELAPGGDRGHPRAPGRGRRLEEDAEEVLIV